MGLTGRGAVVSASTLALAVLAAVPGGAGGATPCTPARNIELINDDSGSMAGYDPGKNRLEAAKLLLGKAANRGGTTYGALEFAQESSPIFGPIKVTAKNLGTLSGALTARTMDDGSGAPLAEDPTRRDDGSGTDYNAAFTGANQSNGGADTRIFLTDGGHNEGTYNGAHKTPVKRTYVIGFGTSSSSSDDAQRLQQIATDTGGANFPQTDASNLPGVVSAVDDYLSCATATKSFSDSFTKQGRTKRHNLQISASTRSLEFTLLWQGVANRFDISVVQVRKGKRVVAQGSRRRRKPARLRVTRQLGATFLTVRVRGKGLRKGRRIRFAVKARRTVGVGSVTTTVAQSRGR